MLYTTVSLLFSRRVASVSIPMMNDVKFLSEQAPCHLQGLCLRKVGVCSNTDTYRNGWEWYTFLYDYLKRSEGNKSLVQHNAASSLM
jgi:VanZ family protein